MHPWCIDLPTATIGVFRHTSRWQNVAVLLELDATDTPATGMLATGVQLRFERGQHLFEHEQFPSPLCRVQLRLEHEQHFFEHEQLPSPLFQPNKMQLRWHRVQCTSHVHQI